MKETATKRDLSETELRLQKEIQETKLEIKTVEANLQIKIQDSELRLQKEIEKTRLEIEKNRVEMKQMETNGNKFCQNGSQTNAVDYWRNRFDNHEYSIT